MPNYNQPVPIHEGSNVKQKTSDMYGIMKGNTIAKNYRGKGKENAKDKRK